MTKRNSYKLSKPKRTVIAALIIIFLLMAGFVFYRTIGVNSSPESQNKCPDLDPNAKVTLEIGSKCADSN